VTLGITNSFLGTVAGGGVTAEELGGMVLLTPTSIAYTGTSASIGANGSVEFTAVTSLSLNGVFSADYDNYMVVMRMEHNATTASSYEGVRARLRTSGTDNSTASSYTNQFLNAASTTVSGSRASYDFGSAGIAAWNANKHNGVQLSLFGPYLTQPTAARTTTISAYLGAEIYDAAWTHNQSVSYDGLTMYVTAVSFTGLVSVYGMVGS